MPTSSALPPAEAPISVAVIDDSDDLRFLVRQALERSGQFRVVAEAGDGEQAVAVTGAAQPDLVLLDIVMPVMDGLTALPLIRSRCPDAVVVMLSALGDGTGMPQRAMALGANGYIHKDGRLLALPEKLRVIMAGAIAERAARDARDSTQPERPRSVG